LTGPERQRVSVPALFWTLVSDTLDDTVLEVEFTARHIEPIRRTFALDWNTLNPVPGIDDARLQYGSLADGRVLWAVIAERVTAASVELVAFRVIDSARS
jgi:hypothetical protein